MELLKLSKYSNDTSFDQISNIHQQGMMEDFKQKIMLRIIKKQNSYFLINLIIAISNTKRDKLNHFQFFNNSEKVEVGF